MPRRARVGKVARGSAIRSGSLRVAMKKVAASWVTVAAKRGRRSFGKPRRGVAEQLDHDQPGQDPGQAAPDDTLLEEHGARLVRDRLTDHGRDRDAAEAGGQAVGDIANQE